MKDQLQIIYNVLTILPKDSPVTCSLFVLLIEELIKLRNEHEKRLQYLETEYNSEM